MNSLSLLFLPLAEVSCALAVLLRAWPLSFLGVVPMLLPHECHCSVGILQGVWSHPEFGRRWSVRPVTCACRAFASMERCHWAAACWRLWQACDCSSGCLKPGIFPDRLKLGVEDSKDPYRWVRGQRKTGRLSLRAGFDDKPGNSRDVCCCRSQLCSFLVFSLHR